MNVLKTCQRDTFSVASLGRPQDVDLNIFNKRGFQGDFSIFPDAKSILDIAEPKQVKNLKRPKSNILALLWSGMSLPK